MPIRDGFETLREIRHQQHTRSIPVVIVTSRADSETITEAMQCGATDFLSKPFTAIDLHKKASFALLPYAEQRIIRSAAFIETYPTAFADENEALSRKKYFLNYADSIYANMLYLIDNKDFSELNIITKRLLKAANQLSLSAARSKLVRFFSAIKKKIFKMQLHF